MVIYHIDMVIPDIDMGYGLMIWEMSVSIWSSRTSVSIWDILSLWAQCMTLAASQTAKVTQYTGVCSVVGSAARSMWPRSCPAGEVEAAVAAWAVAVARPVTGVVPLPPPGSFGFQGLGIWIQDLGFRVQGLGLCHSIPDHAGQSTTPFVVADRPRNHRMSIILPSPLQTASRRFRCIVVSTSTEGLFYTPPPE